LFGLSARFGMQWSWIGFSLTGLIPVSSININEPEADVKLRLGSAGASLCLVLGHGLVKPVLRLGYVLWISGAKVRGKESYSANSNLELTSGPQLFLGSAIGRKRISFTFGILLGMTASSLNYKIENRTVAKSGRPVLGISIGAALLSKQLKRGRK
jgi:hypothetical protein